jgi:hypothetical protein
MESVCCCLVVISRSKSPKRDPFRQWPRFPVPRFLVPPSHTIRPAHDEAIDICLNLPDDQWMRKKESVKKIDRLSWFENSLQIWGRILTEIDRRDANQAPWTNSIVLAPNFPILIFWHFPVSSALRIASSNSAIGQIWKLASICWFPVTLSHRNRRIIAMGLNFKGARPGLMASAK